MSSFKETDEHPYCGSVRINFPSERQACIVRDCMIVDEELQPQKVTKNFEVEGADLVIHVQATELRMLRVALSSFFDMVSVSVKTLLEFDDSSA